VNKSRFTDKQILDAVVDADAGRPIEEICKRLGTSETTIYRLKVKFSGMSEEQIRLFRFLEAEKHRLRKLLRDQRLENGILEELLQRVGVGD